MEKGFYAQKREDILKIIRVIVINCNYEITRRVSRVVHLGNSKYFSKARM